MLSVLEMCVESCRCGACKRLKSTMIESGQNLVNVSKQYIMVSVDGKENDSIGVRPNRFVPSQHCLRPGCWVISALQDLVCLTVAVKLSTKFPYSLLTHYSAPVLSMLPQGLLFAASVLSKIHV